MRNIIGPFKQVITLESLPTHGPIKDSALNVRQDVAVEITDGLITAIGPVSELQGDLIEIPTDCVAMPGIVDAHTHICFAGSRVNDYALRLSGIPYEQIAAAGGGILDTVRHTRAATEQELAAATLSRLRNMAQQGVTTCEIKSGYGLSVEAELKMLRAIKSAAQQKHISVVATCLAAHTLPPEYSDREAYLVMLAKELLPTVAAEQLAERVDIFVDNSAFSVEQARHYLLEAKRHNLSITIHADQFSRGGSALAAEVRALSADHLEQSVEEDYANLAKADVAAIVLPGATLGLGMPWPKARAMLDYGLSLAIASDWNPGSAPMGYLLAQAALLGAAQHLTMAETWAGITFRAARALGLSDRGTLSIGSRADIAVYPCIDYREILYHQGSLMPYATYVKGRRSS